MAFQIMLPVSILLKKLHMFLGQSLKIIFPHVQICFSLHFILLAQCKTCDECKSMHLTRNFAYNADYFLHPTPTCNTAFGKASCVVLPFPLVSTDIDSCLPHNVEKIYGT